MTNRLHVSEGGRRGLAQFFDDPRRPISDHRCVEAMHDDEGGGRHRDDRNDAYGVEAGRQPTSAAAVAGQRASLLLCVQPCYHSIVKCRFTFRWFLPILAVVGVILSPIAAPPGGNAMAASVVAAMPDDMPCCLQEQNAKSECQNDCPMMKTCMVKCFAGPLFFPAATIPFDMLGTVVNIGWDFFVNSLGEEPPARPPRT
jgi:hypothetical protein